MDIKPWNEEIQPLGLLLNEQWLMCEDQFLSIFSNSNESVDEDASNVNVSLRGFIGALVHTLHDKQELLSEYLNTSDGIIRTINTISERARQDSFEGEDESNWFVHQIHFLQSRFRILMSGIVSLLNNTRIGIYGVRTLSMLFSFHNSLNELSKYCLLRMDVKRVQRKLVARALTRIDGTLWQSIQSQKRETLRNFLRQCKYRYANLNNLRSVMSINYNLEEGIIYADKAYYPQTHKSKGNIQIRTIQSLTLDLGDNDILAGSYSLDRKLEGFIAQESTIAESPVIIAYKGTDFTNGHDWTTDYIQAVSCANDVYLMALGLLLCVRDFVGSSRTVKVYGHSLGGGLMQFAVSSAPSGRIYGYGYNSAGLSSGTMRLIPQPMHIDKIRHFRVRKDWVMATGEQVGVIEQLDSPTYNCGYAHLTKTIRKVLNKTSEYVNIK